MIVASSYNDHRQQCRTKDSCAEIRSHVTAHRKLFLLISAEVERGRRTGIQESDGGERDGFACYILDKTEPHCAHCAAYCLASARIRNESHEVRPAPLKQKTRKQPQNQGELRRRTHIQSCAQDRAFQGGPRQLGYQFRITGVMFPPYTHRMNW